MSDNDNLIDRLRIDDAVREAPTTRWVWPVLGLFTVALVVAAVWFWLNSASAIEVSVVSPEMIETGSSAPVASVLDASGFVVARRQATVAAEVTGKLTEVLVEEGMVVEAGQVLARLDDATERARLELAQARLTAGERSVREIEVRLNDAGRTLNRLQSLHERELVSQADLDQAETAFNSLTAQLDSARQQVEVGHREVQLQQQLLDELTVRAPFAGVVIARAAQVGEMVSPVSAGGGFTRTGIATIVDMDSLEIEVDVNESFIDRVSPTQGVVAILDAYPDWEIPAAVTTVVPAADRQKATVRVRIGFDQLDARILPDMGIRVRFLETGSPAPDPVTASRSSVPAIPAHALFEQNGNQFIFVIDEDVVERRAIRTGGTRGSLLLIVAGVAANEQVVANVRDLDLTDGDAVRVVND
ncbi:MAG: efflux RND transporter periplasmic adaptor subunit [Pseudomonadota bacterium]